MADEPRRRWSTRAIRMFIANDRELDAQASKNWRHTHETIVRDRDQKIVANMFTLRAPARPSDLMNARPGAPQSYNGWETDPAYELKDARFIVHARQALPRRADIIEQLLDDRAALVNCLENLFAMVEGEAPSLLRDHHLYPKIKAVLERAENDDRPRN